MALSDDTIRYSMCLCAALASIDIAQATGDSETNALAQLLQSQTGAMLYDDTLKLWHESPRTIAEEYLNETHLRVPANWQ